MIKVTLLKFKKKKVQFPLFQNQCLSLGFKFPYLLVVKKKKKKKKKKKEKKKKEVGLYFVHLWFV